MSLSACVDSFILTVLCGNPIMKGAFVTVANGIVIQLDQEIESLTVEMNRLNLVNRVLSLEIQAVQAIVNKVQADLNIILGPLQDSGNCPEISRFTEAVQNNAVGKSFSALQKKLYEFNRSANLAVYMDAFIKQKQQVRDQTQEMIDRIAQLCP